MILLIIGIVAQSACATIGLVIMENTGNENFLYLFGPVPLVLKILVILYKICYKLIIKIRRTVK